LGILEILRHQTIIEEEAKAYYVVLLCSRLLKLGCCCSSRLLLLLLASFGDVTPNKKNLKELQTGTRIPFILGYLILLIRINQFEGDNLEFLCFFLLVIDLSHWFLTL
jgi:hypothetical protein